MAGGFGSRLRPITSIINKHLLIIYDKPMIYYPLSTLMLGGIRDILLITNSKDIENFRVLLGDGSRFGIKIQYETQDHPGACQKHLLLVRNLLTLSLSV